MVNYWIINGQENYTVISNDKKVSAKHFLGLGEGLDSIIIIYKNYKLKLSNDQPLFDIDGIVNTININPDIKKINKKVYLLYGIGTLAGGETQINFIFIKKNKISKYYILRSKNRMLKFTPPFFKYFPKKREGMFSILKSDTFQDYIYEVDIKNNTYDTIQPIKKGIQKDREQYTYRLKTQ